MGTVSFTDLLQGVINIIDPKPEEHNDKPIILTAAKLKELRWMTAQQIGAIYKYGKVKVRVADDANAYKELRWMSQNQLEALFGKENNA